MEDRQPLARRLGLVFVYVDVVEAHSQAGRAVATTWSRARVLAEPELVSDVAKDNAVEATATKIRKVDEQKRWRHQNKAAATKARDESFLRQPGKCTEAEEKDESKERFIEPLVQPMRDCKVGRAENASATEKEIMNSLRRMATSVVGAAESQLCTEPKPQQTRSGLSGRQSDAHGSRRCGTYSAGGVLMAVARSCASSQRQGLDVQESTAWMTNRRGGEATHQEGILDWQGMKAGPSSTARHVQGIDRWHGDSCRNRRPNLAGLLASWLHATANLRLGHVLRRSIPVELYSGWILFFWKRGKQRHVRAGFYWGAPSETACGMLPRRLASRGSATMQLQEINHRLALTRA